MCDCQQTKKVFDTIDFTSSKREVLADGSLVIRDCKIARIGVQHYGAREMGLDGNGMVGVYRPAEEVFDAGSIESFEGLPVTLNHPAEFVTDANIDKLKVGFVSNVRRSGDFMVADLTITEKALAAKMQERDAGGKYKFSHGEISNGYAHSLELKDGVFNGQRYSAIQRDIRGNHVALVTAARCGPSCRVSDADHTTHTKEKTLMSTDSAPALRAMDFQGQQVMINDAAGLIISKLSADLATSAAALTAANDAAAKSATQIADLTKENADLKANQLTDDMVADVVTAIDQCKAIAADAEIKGTPADMRRAAIGKVHEANKAVVDAALAGVTLDKASDDALKIIAGILVATKGAPAKPTQGGNYQPSKAADGQGYRMQQADRKSAVTADGKPRLSAHAEFLARQNR